MKRLIAIDGNSLLFRAYHATAAFNLMQASDGTYTNALYSFINMMHKIEKTYEFDYIIVAFDASKETFRKKEYDAYKGTRARSPEELNMQFPLVREYLNLSGIANYEVEGYEADDIIGTLSTMGCQENIHVDVVTSDKDMLQLIDPCVDILMPVKGGGDLKVVNMDNLKEIWDVSPKQVIDLKGLMGDSSDNIPGVKGVGEKTAIKLLKEYDSVEGIYEHIDEIKGAAKKKLEADKDNAFLSKRLATIVTDMDLPFKLAELTPKEYDKGALKNFFYKYDMKSLVKKLDDVEDVQEERKEVEYQVVKEMPKEALVAGSFFNLISVEDNYHFADYYGIVVCAKENTYVIKKEDVMNDQNLLDYLKNTSKITHDGKKNICLGKWHGLEIANISDDLMLSTYLIDVDKKNEANVLVDTNFNVATLADKDLAKQDVDQIIKAKAIQAYYLEKLLVKHQEQMQKDELIEVYNVEIKIMSILADMELKGITIETAELKELTKEYKQISNDLETQINGYVPNKVDEDGNEIKFNVNSPAQLAQVLFEDLNLPYPGANGKKVAKKSTSVDILNELYDDHPIIPLILEYRTYKKLLSTYLSPMPKFIKEDGRVHTIYRQAFTQTGRLSSKEPNLQNIATKTDVQKQVKRIFVSKEGSSLLSFDYSQIELRVLASFSNDPVFIKAFNDGEDIHASTAAKVNHVDLDQVTPEERSKAKATNFGIIYGLSDYGLARQINVSREEAAKFIKRYYEIYPNIHGYLNHLIEETKERGYTRTILNRIRYIKDINANNYNIRQNAQRQAMNTPIQGSAADILKLAMINVDQKLKELDLNVDMLLQVHDELIFEVADQDLEKVIPIIKKEMEEAYKLDVKLVVDYVYGKNWYELK